MITIQAGNYSNFVGAHLFNLQNPENVLSTNTPNDDDPSTKTTTATSLWREARSNRGPHSSSSSTFSPRLIIFDSKENVDCFGHTTNTLSAAAYQHKQNPALWDGTMDNLMEVEAPAGEDGGGGPTLENIKNVALGNLSVPKPPTDYSRWGDYARWRVSPDFVHLLPNFSHNAESGMLDSFAQGVEVWKTLEERAEESVRIYAEEVDRLEGFNLLVDQLDGYSGLGGGILQHLSDEYEKKVFIGLGLVPPVLSPVQSEVADGRAYRTKMTNTTLLWNAFNSYSTVFTSIGLCRDFSAKQMIPITLPYLKFKVDSYYESSAVLATALDTLLSPCITSVPSSSSFSLQELASFLNAMGRKMTSISTSFPFPLDIKKSSLFGTLNSNGLESLRGLTPGVSLDFLNANGNFFAIKGIPDAAIIAEQERKGVMGQHRHIRNAQSCLDLFATETFPRAVNVVQSSDSPVTITDPFPCKVVEEFAKERFKFGQRYSNGAVNSWSFGCISSAHNGTQCGDIIDKVLQISSGRGTNRNKVTQRLPASNELGMDEDDFMESVNNLETLRSTYDIN